MIAYARQNTGSLANIHFGDENAENLRGLPDIGPLLPQLRRVGSGDRATEFKQRCDGLGIAGVSLHSYLYAWAERARKCGYPERFAQEALGLNSKAVRRSHAKRAQVRQPSLENYERSQPQENVIEINAQAGSGTVVAPETAHAG